MRMNQDAPHNRNQNKLELVAHNLLVQCCQGGVEAANLHRLASASVPHCVWAEHNVRYLSKLRARPGRALFMFNIIMI